MKMVKSLLLSSAAGLFAVAGAQAADLPVKAKPVEYVKICSLYGAGFYYMPGTDICIKVGGYVRAEYAYGANGNQTTGIFNSQVNNRLTNDSTWRSRAYITADTRQQTEYGTLRTYLAVGLISNTIGDPGIAFNSNRAFIQFAGFTFGLASSFFDFYSIAASSYWGSFGVSDTGDSGWQVAAYTAQFGNGFSATLSAEDRRMNQIIGADSAAGAIQSAAFGSIAPSGSFVGAAMGNGAYGGWQSPDIVANLRVDQAWGSAQIMGALHELNATYYGTGLEPAGGPGNEWGFAVGAGLKLLAPSIGPGDYFQAQVTYTEGATRYLTQTQSFNAYNSHGNQAAYGVLSDSVYGGFGATATSQQLTTAWGVSAAYDHFWSPRWQTSVYGGYEEFSYNDRANAILCSAALDGAGLGNAAVANAGCDNNWSTAYIGSRTQWNVTKGFYMGLDVLYRQLNSASSSTGFVFARNRAPATASGAVPQAIADTDDWAVRFRVHRDFLP